MTFHLSSFTLCNKRIKLHVLTYSLGHPLVFCAHILVQIWGVVSCIHTPSHTKLQHMLLHRRVLGCSFDAPPAKWSCCFLAPVTVETADCITSAHQSGTARWKRETISPCFYLLTSVIAVAPFSFFLCTPFAPFTLPFMSPAPLSLFIKNPKKWKKKTLADLVFHIWLRMSLTPQSTRYYQGLPTDLNPNLKRHIWICLLWLCLAVGAEGNAVSFSL